MKKSELQQIIREEAQKVLHESFTANSKLANALTFIKKNSGELANEDPKIKMAMEKVNKSGVTSKDVFSFAALFPRDTFKVDDIRTGKLHNKIKQSYINADQMKIALVKADALKDFLLAFDEYHGGTKDWYKKY